LFACREGEASESACVCFSFFLFGRGFGDGKQGKVVIMEFRMRQRRLPAVARRQQVAVARGR
jgi:hypothetical protein